MGSELCGDSGTFPSSLRVPAGTTVVGEATAAAGVSGVCEEEASQPSLLGQRCFPQEWCSCGQCEHMYPASTRPSGAPGQGGTSWCACARHARPRHVCSTSSWATSCLALTWERTWNSPEGRKQVGAHSRGSGPPPRWRWQELSGHTHARYGVARARGFPTGWEPMRGQQTARPYGGQETRGAMGRGRGDTCVLAGGRTG